MEQPSCKSHVVDITTAGADVIVHLECLLGQRKAKICIYVGMCTSTFTMRIIMGWATGKPAWCLTVQELL